LELDRLNQEDVNRKDRCAKLALNKRLSYEACVQESAPPFINSNLQHSNNDGSGGDLLMKFLF
jgi:hypothetical protein